MDLPNALHQLASNPAMFAARPSGKLIRITPGFVLFHMTPAGAKPWKPCFNDIVAMDWVTGTLEQLAKLFQDSQQAVG